MLRVVSGVSRRVGCYVRIVLPRPRVRSGVRYADIAVGKGAEAKEGVRVALQWVLRRSNGYFVDGSVNTVLGASKSDFDPFIFTVGDGKALPGLDEAVRARVGTDAKVS